MKNDPNADDNKTTPRASPRFSAEPRSFWPNAQSHHAVRRLDQLIAFLQQIGFGARIAQAMPFPATTSPTRSR